MSEMKKELTKEEKQKMIEYYNEGIKVGTATHDTGYDENLVGDTIEKIYKIANLPKPLILWGESPIDCVKKKRTMNEEPMDEESINSDAVSECWFGQHEVYWIFFYRYCNEVLGVQYDKSDYEKLHLWNHMAANANWWYPYENVCFISRKPTEVHIAPTRAFEIDGEKAWDIYHLHWPNGPAVLFSDGFGIYSINGVKVPDWLVDTPANKIDPKKLFEVDNAEVRREFVRKIGLERIYEGLGGQSVDRKIITTLDAHMNPQELEYEVVLLNMGDDRDGRPHLLMRNPSIGTFHIEGVHPDFANSVEEALNWRNGGLGSQPLILT